MAHPTNAASRQGRRRTGRLVALAALTAFTAACAPSGDDTAGEGADGEAAAVEWPTSSVRIMAPADPGGGWDQTARAVQEVLGGMVEPSVEVYNVGGAGGTVGIAQFVQNEGSADDLMMMGSIMVGAIETNQSPVTLDEVTPLARLIGETEVIVAPPNSPYQTIDELLAAMEEDVGSVAIAGGSAGGIEQVLAALIAQEIGAEPTDVNYIAHSGGGEALATILSGRVQAGISGLAEIQEQIDAGQVKALAVSSAEPIEGIDAPTLMESGLDIELTNWRGLVAPAGIEPEVEAAMEEQLQAMAESEEWQAILEQRGWEDQFLAGEEFEEYLDAEQERTRGVLEDLGLVT